jgi:hypothetical protein
MLADEITPAMDGIPAEKAAPLPARGREAESWLVLHVHERTGACVREAVKAAKGERGADQETFSTGGKGGWCARATRGRGAPLREQEKNLVTLRTRAELKASFIVEGVTNEAHTSVVLQEVRQR